MGKSVNLIFTGVIAALLMCQSGLAEDLQAKAPNKTFSVASAEEAIGRALEYTGFDKSKGFSIEESIGEVKLETARDTITPFLHDRIDGRTIWAVEFDGILLNPESVKPEKIEANPKNFEVWLDAETGILLRVFSPYTGSDRTGLSVITAKQAEHELKSGGEEYRGFPDSIPHVNCFDALNADRFGSPLFAKEIHALYVLNSRPRNEKATPMWIIALCEPPASPLDIDYRYGLTARHSRRSRILIDAQTGEIIVVRKRFSPIKSESD